MDAVGDQVLSPIGRRVSESTALRLCLFGAAFYVAWALASLSQAGPDSVTAIWPASGMVLAVLMLSPQRRWPLWLGAMWVTNAAVGVFAGSPLLVMAAYSTTDVIEQFLAATLLVRVVGTPFTLGRLKEVVALVLVAAIGSNAITASLGGGVTALNHGLPFWPTWFSWWMSNAVGMLQVAPLILAWRDGVRYVKEKGLLGALEIGLLLATLAIVCVMVFLPYDDRHAGRGWPLYLVFPWLMWAAIRSGPFFATVASLVVAGFAIWSTVHGSGPFVAEASSVTVQVLLLQGFMSVAVLSSLLTAAVVAEYRRAQASTEQYYQLSMAREAGRIAAEEASASANRRFRVVFENANDAILLIDAGQCVDCNPRAEVLFGLSRDDVVGAALFDLSPPLQPDGQRSTEAARERLRAALAGQPQYFEWTHRRSDGALFDVEVALNAVELEGRKMLAAIVRDVTERRRLETELRQAQKMEAVGRLAGGIAHDFNNLLQVIRGFTELALDAMPEASAEHEALDEVRKATERATELTGRLLVFSRKQVIAPVVCNVNSIITDVESMLGRLIGEDIELTTDLAADLGSVKADPNLLQQVVLNLAVNARDAMPHGGKLTMRTANVRVSEADATQHGNLHAGPHAMFVVSDTGTGMPEAVQARVFEPFFTTKTREKGTGLGLSTVYGIVRQSGGHVTFTSQVGVGTVFQVLLPIVEGAAAATVADVRRAESSRGSETILLVEDDGPVRAFARTLLERSGYRVLEAAGGPDAIKIAEVFSEPIQLVLTDVIMPGMAGPEVARRVRATRPATRVLYMSGYTDDAISHHGVLDEGVALLPKPFSAEALAAKVRQVLDA
ncbi:MAG: MASE1 domain-containing protein [Acidobacteria bacterium]|nr:MASE1 domain-containing protein [Acidobacteriota bacterium]